jgi:hypothetical protein
MNAAFAVNGFTADDASATAAAAAALCGRRYTRRRSRVAARTVRMGGGGGEEAMGDLGMGIEREEDDGLISKSVGSV